MNLPIKKQFSYTWQGFYLIKSKLDLSLRKIPVKWKYIFEHDSSQRKAFF